MTPQDTERDELLKLIAKLYVDSHTAWPEARATEWPDVFAEKAGTAINQLYAKREREAEIRVMEKMFNALLNIDAFSDDFKVKQLSKLIRELTQDTAKEKHD